jgi:hypothetical protein
MQPVWVLSVDLQTKTASFTSGLGDAARTARGAFSDIKSGGGEMGRAVGGNMMEARHGVMLLGEEFGIHLPRALTMFISSIGPVGAAMEAAFPFLAIIVGATLLIEHLARLREAGEKLTEDQTKFGTAVLNAFNSLDERLIQAQIKSDELKNDHLGALRGELELIDRQSLAELAKQFDDLAKSADEVFAGLKVSWYQLGIGSDGAKHALIDFQLEYKKLLAEGKNEQASGLLTGTLDQAQRTLNMMQQLSANRTGDGQKGDYQKYEQAANFLREKNLLSSVSGDITKTEVQSQEALVAALQAQVGIQSRVENLKNKQGKNATDADSNTQSAKAAAAAKEAADHAARMGQQTIAADRAVADAQLAVKHASVEQRLASDIDFADRERAIQLAANAGQIAALDKHSKDYVNQLAALKDKSIEIEGQHAATVTELRAKASIEANTRDITALEQGIREQIAATQQGSAERLAAIDAGIRMEEAHNQQDSNFYRELLTQRVQAARQEAEQEAQIRQQMGKIEAEYETQSGMQILAARQKAIELSESLAKVSMQRRISDQAQASNLEFLVKQAAIRKEAEALDKSAKDYQARLKESQNKEKLLVQQHENDLTAIKVNAEIQRNQRIQAAESQLKNTIADGLTQSIMQHQSWGQMVASIGDQVVSGIIKNSILIALQEDKDRFGYARTAATAAFKWGWEHGGPAAPILAPVMAAVAFAGAMAFEQGTDRVPGVSRGDTVPAMLEPGEGVVPGGVMDGLRNVAKNGGFERGHVIHVHATFAPSVQAFDSTGVDGVLEQHADKFHKHIEKTIRRMNK